MASEGKGLMVQDDEVARRLVMPRSVWDRIVAAAEKAGEIPAEHASKLLTLGLNTADDLAAEGAPPVEVHGLDGHILAIMDRVGPTTNAKLRVELHGSEEAAEAGDPAGREATKALGRLKAAGLVVIDGTPRRWLRTARRWRLAGTDAAHPTPTPAANRQKM